MKGPEAVVSSRSVPGWDRYHDWHQQMGLKVEASTADVLQGLAAGLKESRFRIKATGDLGFTARYVDWFAVLAQSLDWTTLDVSADPSGEPERSRIVVSVLAGGEHRSGHRRATEGLSAAVDGFRRRGLAVEMTPWESRD